MSSLLLLGDTSGSVLLQAPAIAGSTSITLAANSGTLCAGAPLFAAYPNTSQSFSSGVTVKVQVGQEIYDTNNCYDNTTNYRFTPTVAGYYQIAASMTMTYSSSSGIFVCYVYKNGNSTLGGQSALSSERYVTSSANGIIYLNGTTDYIEMYLWQNTGGNITTLTGRPDLNNFSAAWVRGA